MFTKYDANFEDIVFDLIDDIIAQQAAKGGTGGGAGGTTPKPADKLSETDIYVYVKAGRMTPQEAAGLIGERNAEILLAKAPTSAQSKQIAALKASPAATPTYDIDSFESQANVAKGVSTVSGEPFESGPPSESATRAATTASATSSRASGGSRGGGGGPSSPPAAAPEPPPPVANSADDLVARGAMNVGGRALLNGQQYLRPEGAVQNPQDGLWYVVGPDGQPAGTGFKTQAAANRASPFTPAGPAITSRFGNSPTARAAQVGGFSRTVDNPNFDLIPLDESIAATATKGAQRGDIIGTSVREGYPSLDITLGGISEGGGLTPVGNPVDPYASFTGQLPGNVAIGQSSILAGGMDSAYGRGPLYWLQQSTGIPMSTLAQMVKTPEQALQLEQATATLRGQGLMPDLASLYALNEPSGYQGASGGDTLKWGSANGGSSNTPYDRALAAFSEYALGSPDLELFPDVSMPGESGGQQMDYWWLDPTFDTYAKGGEFMTSGPLAMVDIDTGQLKGLAGEAGYDEKVTIDPLGQDVMLGRERSMGGWRGVKKFATGGMIYTGKGFVENPATMGIYDDAGNVTEHGARLGYKSDPFITIGRGASFVHDEGGGGHNFAEPRMSKTGQPVPASYDRMSPEQRERFTNQGNRPQNQRISGPLTANPIGMDPRTGLPIYEQLNPETHGGILGDPDGYSFVPMDMAGVPVLVRVPEWQNRPFVSPSDRRAKHEAYLQKIISGGSGPGWRPEYGNITTREQAIAALYDLNPKAATMLAMQGGGRGRGGWRGGRGQDRDIINQAARERYYGIDARNRARAGMDPATILDIPRVEGWEGEGEAPYQRYRGFVPEGYVLPFDYDSPWFNRDNSRGFDRFYDRDHSRGRGRGGWRGRERGFRYGGRDGRRGPMQQPADGRRHGGVGGQR